MALLDAAERGSVAMCRQLLAAGSDVRERDKYGDTPLMGKGWKGILSWIKKEVREQEEAKEKILS